MEHQIGGLDYLTSWVIYFIRSEKITDIQYSNGVRQELKFQMALQHKLGLCPVQWQYRFRTLANKCSFPSFFLSIHVLVISENEENA